MKSLYNEDLINLYIDFMFEIVTLTHETYLGDELTNYSNQIAHLNWVIKKVSKQFKEEKITINLTPNLKKYLEDVMITNYYQNPKKNIKLLNRLKKNCIDLDAYINIFLDTSINVLSEFNHSLHEHQFILI